MIAPTKAAHTAGPLRKIIGRPSDMTEQLECAHIIQRPLRLGEAAQVASTAKRRRCYKCAAEARSNG